MDEQRYALSVDSNGRNTWTCGAVVVQHTIGVSTCCSCSTSTRLAHQFPIRWCVRKYVNLPFNLILTQCPFRSDAPETILSILHCLGETMTVHVACTTWDKQFRLTLVSASLPIDYKFERTEFYTSKTEVFQYVLTACVFTNWIHSMHFSCKEPPPPVVCGANCCTR